MGMAGVASTGKTGLGIVLEVSDGAQPATWATVANVTDLNFGGTSRTVIDRSHLNSPDGYRERIVGLKQGEDITFTAWFDPTDPTLDSTTGIRKFFEDGSLETFRANMKEVFPGYGIEVDAFVTNIGNITISVEGIVSMPVTLTVNGKPREVTIA
jgi:hypothetical protein